MHLCSYPTECKSPVEHPSTRRGRRIRLRRGRAHHLIPVRCLVRLQRDDEGVAVVRSPRGRRAWPLIAIGSEASLDARVDSLTPVAAAFIVMVAEKVDRAVRENDA